jgi:hypothetical protein
MLTTSKKKFLSLSMAGGLIKFALIAKNPLLSKFQGIGAQFQESTNMVSSLCNPVNTHSRRKKIEQQDIDGTGRFACP